MGIQAFAEAAEEGLSQGDAKTLSVVALIAGAGIAVVLIVSIVFYVLYIIANWKIFTKAGEKGWKSIIPIYNGYVSFRIAWKTSMFWIMLAISVLMGVFSSLSGGQKSGIWYYLYVAASIAVFVIYIIYCVKLSKSFGHGGGFAVGLIFLDIIFVFILAFGSSKYIGPEGENGATPTPIQQ